MVAYFNYPSVISDGYLGFMHLTLSAGEKYFNGDISKRIVQNRYWMSGKRGETVFTINIPTAGCVFQFAASGQGYASNGYFL